MANLKSVGASFEHESAVQHVTGRATYVDDIAEPADRLHVATGLSTIAHGRILSMDLDAVRAAEGVVDVITISDIHRVKSWIWDQRPLASTQ